MASAASIPLPPRLERLGGGASNAIAYLIQQVRPSVVQIQVHGRGVGAGVIWDSDGGIVTNRHVVGEAEGPLQVLLGDGRTMAAQVVRRHPAADLALLQIPAGGLQPASAGDSEALRVGQLVFAIGHPWGQPDVVTAGIVSGAGDTPARWGGRPVDYIRSDVRLAPGNSGGPLIDAAGQVVGINSMIWGGDLSAAIPSHVVQRWLARGQAPPAFLGVELRPVELRTQRDRSAGLLVSGLRADGPAERAGLLLGDVVVGVDGEPVPEPEALAEALAARQPGETAVLEVVRAGAIQRLEVALGAAARA
ncbi:MAG TPA: trypsin-like peptidase domain-containing protein [Chloroflexota bacterium]|nr:trypsin-like peptidase domain-containing protein [Chloroflexota bacterium]